MEPISTFRPRNAIRFNESIGTMPPMLTFTPHRRRDGFTLIELILVVAIIAIIAGTIFVALDPGKRLHVSRNSRRWSDVTSIVKAIKTYEVDNAALPGSIDSAEGTIQMLGTASGSDCPPATCEVAGVAQTFPGSACTIDLATALKPYLKSIPMDPQATSDANTRYYVNRENGVVWVGACDSEGEGNAGTGTPPTILVSQ